MNTARTILRLLSSGGLFALAGLLTSELRRRLGSNETFTCFEYDLEEDLANPLPPIRVELGTLHEQDIDMLFLAALDPRDGKELRKRLECLRFLAAKIPVCYVGVVPDGRPCAICWLIRADQSLRLRSYFNGGIPPLRDDDVLLEYVYVHPDYRGRGLMEWITYNLFKKAAQAGAHRAIALVSNDNRLSLKVSRRIGWQPCLVKSVEWRLFRRRIRFEHLKVTNGDDDA